MIKSIILHNFQSHKDTRIELSTGVNVFKGTSHHGKSSIIRGLRWLLQNRPQGDGFVSWFAKPKDKTDVAVDLSDGFSVVRSKSNGVNEYLLWNVSGRVPREEAYKALRSEVPEPVQQALNMSSINLQEQREMWFLLELSSGEVARQLNEYVGLSVLDESQKRVNSIATKAKADSAEFERKIQVTTEKITKLRWLRKAKQELDRVQELAAELDVVEQRLNDLQYIDAEMQRLEKLIAQQSKITKYSAQIKTIMQTLDDCTVAQQRLYALMDIANMVENTKRKIHTADEDIQLNLKKRVIILKSVKICPVCNKPM